MPIFNTCLAVVMALAIVYPVILTWEALFEQHWGEEPNHPLEKPLESDSPSLRIADLLQHVETSEEEICAFCHDDKPVAPVRISCQHLFCCGCAHAMFARVTLCPLCLQKPSPFRDSFPTLSAQRDESFIDSQLSRLYEMCGDSLILFGLATMLVCPAYMIDFCDSFIVEMYPLQIRLSVLFWVVAVVVVSVRLGWRSTISWILR